MIPKSERPHKPCSECGAEFQQTQFESGTHFDKRATCGRYACVRSRTRKRQNANWRRRRANRKVA